MPPRATENDRASLIEEIVRLETRVAQLEAAALVDRAPAETGGEPLDRAADPHLLRRGQLLQATAIGVTSATGAAFFRLLARHLAHTLACDCAVVGVLPPGQADRVRTLAFFADHNWLGNIEYELAGTPCEQVVRRDLCIYRSEVRRHFPRDQWLADWRIEAYAGVPLVDSRGRVLGLISVLSRSPLADPEVARSALQIFAVRAAAEVERQQTEESLRMSQAALAESEERFRQMAETIRDIFWLYDIREQRLLYISPAFESIWGRTPEWLYGDPNRWLQGVHEDDRAVAGAMPLPPPRPGKIFDEVYRIRRAGGGLVWLHDRRYALADASGQVQRIVGVAEDITLRREAEDKLEQQLSQLAHLARLSTVGELVASISHEVNQPLYAIGNFSAAIGAALEGKNPPLETLKQLNGEIGRAVDRAGNIIRRVRSYLARGSFERRPIDLAAIVHDSVALLAAEARRRRAAFQLDLVQLPEPLAGDPVGIQQVLVNLLRNALEALPESSGSQTIAVSAWPVDSGVRIAVTDPGCGLSDKDLSHLFEPFYSTKHEGLGMGLAISKTIVEAHEGRIGAERNPAGGTTVWFMLPGGK
jgi:PAS domain S-box-containing protein